MTPQQLAAQWRIWELEAKDDGVRSSRSAEAEDLSVWLGARPKNRRIREVWPVHRNSTKREIAGRKIEKAEAVRWYQKLKQLNADAAVQVRIHKRKQGGEDRQIRLPVHYCGALGSSALRVAECLLLGFSYLHRTGELFPSHAKIAEKTGLSRKTVIEALKRLHAFGVITWVRRCANRVIDGVFTLVQISNQYFFNRPEMWKGYVPDQAKPDPDTWGATQPIPEAADQASAAIKTGSLIAAAQAYETSSDRGHQKLASVLRYAASLKMEDLEGKPKKITQTPPE